MDLDGLFNYPAQRRWWLLTQALASLPFQQALDLARAADQFVGADPQNVSAEMPNREFPLEPASTACGCVTEIAGIKQSAGRLSLSPEQRDQLIGRLAGGEKNADLAAAFSLTPKQVQGIRMGAARQIVRRRAPNLEAPHSKQQATPATVDEVVRYLRQQDDVVVPEGENRFLVNARFHLNLAELVEKANRSRDRHNKPPFRIGGVAQGAEVARSPMMNSWDA